MGKLPRNTKDLHFSLKKGRIFKDCVSVVGFSIPSAFDESDAKAFVEELSEKHSQYVFFSNNKALLTDEKIVKFWFVCRFLPRHLKRLCVELSRAKSIKIM